MKWLRTIVLFDQGMLTESEDWRAVHESLVRSVISIDFPEGAKSLTLRKKTRVGKSQWRRNGVKYLRTRFLSHMVGSEGWAQEKQVAIEHLNLQPTLKTYPDLKDYQEPITSGFGHFDFMTETDSGLKVAIEWETGNISSSHRSMNKLYVALSAKCIDVGVLILPSRDLYQHLTDRIGNIGELSPYLTMWRKIGPLVERGLLAVAVVEQDSLTDTESFPYLPTGSDGQAAQGRQKLLIEEPGSEDGD